MDTSFAFVCDLFDFRSGRLTFILNMLSKRCPSIKPATALLDEATRQYQLYLHKHQHKALTLKEYEEVILRLTRPLLLTYELMCFNNNTQAIAGLVLESKIKNHPLQAFIKPLLKAWQIKD